MTTNINNVTALGTGVLGSQIAYQTAYSGFEVTAYDINEEIVKAARKRFEELAARYEREVEGARGGRAQAALAKIKYSWSLADAVRDADLVIESAPERLDVKRQLYTMLGPLAPEKTIFATNSSTLLPSDLADATGRPDRFLALHFANEIWIHNIAEIMGHAGTDPAVYDAVVEFAQRIGMEPIKIQKEQAGYVVNSLLVPFLTATQSLVRKGVADPETIDKSWRIATGAPTGPLQMLDVVGLNTAYNIAAAGDEGARANARYLKAHYIDQGKLGQASGEGFYKYNTAPQVRLRTQSK
ncbi:MAG TPA: 3-hydroxyacyl-CoA dehydrogenase [Vicinamibacteria bacterium]|nr:3-hydroxyacyl-CoA dehydrogenase [Vicinamibacteria bacterium]